MDKRTVFADGLILPRALKVLDHGVLVGEPGSVWLMRDTDGDLKADTKELITHAYGRLEGSVEGNANSLYWALDNWMHTSGTDVYFRFKDQKIEVQSTLLRGEWGATQDDAGRIYRNTNESALHVDFVPTPYFMSRRRPIVPVRFLDRCSGGQSSESTVTEHSFGPLKSFGGPDDVAPRYNGISCWRSIVQRLNEDCDASLVRNCWAIAR